MLLLTLLEIDVINKSIKFFALLLLTLNVFAGGDDRDQVYYENLDEELAAFEAELAAGLAAQELQSEIEDEMARQAALEAFQQKLEDEKAAAAASTAAYQSKLARDAAIAARMEELAVRKRTSCL